MLSVVLAQIEILLAHVEQWVMQALVSLMQTDLALRRAFLAHGKPFLTLLLHELFGVKCAFPSL